MKDTAKTSLRLRKEAELKGMMEEYSPTVCCIASKDAVVTDYMVNES